MKKTETPNQVKERAINNEQNVGNHQQTLMVSQIVIPYHSDIQGTATLYTELVTNCDLKG